jgi:hypothetical protein
MWFISYLKIPGWKLNLAADPSAQRGDRIHNIGVTTERRKPHKILTRTTAPNHKAYRIANSSLLYQIPN